MIKQECISEKIFPVNCYNPYEQSNTLKQLSKEPNFIQVMPNLKPGKTYLSIIEESFRRIPEAIEARKNKKYEKRIFPCCELIKKESFRTQLIFQEKNTCVVSGIKPLDGKNRASFLKKIRVGLDIGTGKYINREPSFYYKHKEGMLYCYPYRDYRFSRELPKEIIEQLQKKYPDLGHSGCSYCPVLVVFRDRIIKNADESTKKRLKSSLVFYNKLNGSQKLF